MYFSWIFESSARFSSSTRDDPRSGLKKIEPAINPIIEISKFVSEEDFSFGQKKRWFTDYLLECFHKVKESSNNAEIDGEFVEQIIGSENELVRESNRFWNRVVRICDVQECLKIILKIWGKRWQPTIQYNLGALWLYLPAVVIRACRVGKQNVQESISESWLWDCPLFW